MGGSGSVCEYCFGDGCGSIDVNLWFVIVMDVLRVI